jgi:hypothetical protein
MGEQKREQKVRSPNRIIDNYIVDIIVTYYAILLIYSYIRLRGLIVAAVDCRRQVPQNWINKRSPKTIVRFKLLSQTDGNL